MLCDELYRVMKSKGYPEELCSTIAYKYMNTDFTARRLLGYIRAEGRPREEDLVDEMLAILSDRKQWIDKKMMEDAQAKNNMNKWMFFDEGE